MYSTFSSDWDHERERLDALCAIFDEGTIRHLERLGIEEGWICAELGAGTGSIAASMCRSVGESGMVDAIDIDPRFLHEIASDNPNLKIVQCDVTKYRFIPATYNLVHARMLLTHLPGPSKLLSVAIAALKPGGWVLIEELDACIGGVATPESLALARAYNAMNSLMQKLGGNPFLGRELPLMLRGLQLKNVGSEARAAVNVSGTPGARLLQLGLEFNYDRLIRERLISQEDLDAAIECTRDPRIAWYSTMAVAAWGRR